METAYAMDEPFGPSPGDGGDVDDSASAGGAHRLDDLLDGAHGAGEVDVDDLVPQFVGEAVDVGEVDSLVERAVVYEDVDFSEFADCSGNGVPDLVEVGHVAGDGDGTNAPGAHLLGDLNSLVGVLGVADGEVDAGVGQCDADASTEHAAAAGYESGFLC